MRGERYTSECYDARSGDVGAVVAAGGAYHVGVGDVQVDVAEEAAVLCIIKRGGRRALYQIVGEGAPTRAVYRDVIGAPYSASDRRGVGYATRTEEDLVHGAVL